MNTRQARSATGGAGALAAEACAPETPRVAARAAAVVAERAVRTLRPRVLPAPVLPACVLGWRSVRLCGPGSTAVCMAYLRSRWGAADRAPPEPAHSYN